MRSPSREDSNLIRNFNDDRVPVDEAIRRQLRELARELTDLQHHPALLNLQTNAHSLENESESEVFDAIKQIMKNLLLSISQTRVELDDLNNSFNNKVSSPGGNVSFFQNQLPQSQKEENLITLDFLPSMLWRFALDKTVPVDKRKTLVCLVRDGISFKALIVEHFGCSEEYAERAETLVVEFLNANKRPDQQVLSGLAKLPSSLPDGPPQYRYRPRMDGGIEKYLRDNWGEHIKAGLLSRPDLRKLDPPAAQALTNWLRHHELPADLNLPSKSDELDKAIQRAGFSDPKEADRIAAGLKRRSRNNLWKPS